MGTGTSPDTDFQGFARIGTEPVPIFSQPVRSQPPADRLFARDLSAVNRMAAKRGSFEPDHPNERCVKREQSPSQVIAGEEFRIVQAATPSVGK
jgi:hypothetical protein